METGRRTQAGRPVVGSSHVGLPAYTAEDFTRAAFVFQHGCTPDDYLLAHTLAMVAVGKADENALWIGTATLDRYRHSTGKAQIYGTQFKANPDGTATQEAYNRALVSDALRPARCAIARRTTRAAPVLPNNSSLLRRSRSEAPSNFAGPGSPPHSSIGPQACSCLVSPPIPADPGVVLFRPGRD